MNMSAMIITPVMLILGILCVIFQGRIVAFRFRYYILITILLCGFPLAAHFPVIVDTEESKGLIPEVPFTPIQLGVGFCDHAQLFDGNVHCFAAVGLLGLLQESGAVSFAPINMLRYNFFVQTGALTNISENNFFLTVSPCNLGQKNYGLQTGLFNFSAKDAGLQIGLFNIGSLIQIGLFNLDGQFQIGLLNFNPHAWLKWMPFINFPKWDRD